MSEPDATPGFYELANLDEYYRDCVIGGPGSFFIPVTDMANFAKAIRMKLILEIAERAPVRRKGLVRKAQYVPASSYRGSTDCMIGQKLDQNVPQAPKPK